MVKQPLRVQFAYKVAVRHVYFLLHQREKKELPFNMAVGKEELMH